MSSALVATVPQNPILYTFFFSCSTALNFMLYMTVCPILQRVTFVEGRGNVIIKYPGTTDEVVSFIGSHLDVVPADPKNWDEDPFVLRREGDLIFGRGTTDCLGHVAMLTDFFASLAQARSGVCEVLCA